MSAPEGNAKKTHLDETKITFLSTSTVNLIREMADDKNVVQAAQVSVKGQNKPNTDMPKLINYLMAQRHGSPFEHAVFTFYIESPIFVFREFMRHRIASYNEWSARYSEMQPRFYVPAHDRPLVAVGKSAHPELVEGSDEQRKLVHEEHINAATEAWKSYQRQLKAGVAREVARDVLPVSIMSQMYVTMNARALMNFLSLREKTEDSHFDTRPLVEIAAVASRMEDMFKLCMPSTHAAFIANGRVAP